MRMDFCFICIMEKEQKKQLLDDELMDEVAGGGAGLIPNECGDFTGDSYYAHGTTIFGGRGSVHSDTANSNPL